ncbi:BnaA05g26970D [Brassica napus]|uniref:BnaA05g26970D protein n=1 Tax=Brassica napus TaxID=3708 RepID=A0A078F4X4_BRANA|nr:BnaA05g26970D [Brassica napus]
MAKFGEGDKRWIVEDRPDGTNVHNWHWAETNCLEWQPLHQNQETGEARRRGVRERAQGEDHPRLRAQRLSLLGRRGEGFGREDDLEGGGGRGYAVYLR